MSDDTDAELASLPREELVERARALQTVLRVAQAVTHARSVEDLAERFIDAVAAFTRFPAVVVLRLVPAREGYEIVAQRGFDESKFPPRKVLPAQGSLTGLAVERRQILTTEDIESDDRVDPDTRVALAANAYTSGACVPVVHGGEVLGSFNLVYPRGTSLGAGERRMLGALATSLGVAMAQQVAAERERELETQARRAQQLDSLGILAAGIAHDFNNLLTGIVGNVDLSRVLAQEAGLTRIEGVLAEALDAAGRATTLVRQLLTFARGGAPSRKATDELGRVIREVSSFAARGTSVRCEVEVEEPLGVIEIDVGQIGQVIQNLVLNACQASRSGATVVIRARRSTCRASSSPSSRGGPAGPGWASPSATRSSSATEGVSRWSPSSVAARPSPSSYPRASSRPVWRRAEARPRRRFRGACSSWTTRTSSGSSPRRCSRGSGSR